MSVMNGQKEEKLKKLLGSVPPGFLVDSKWMNRHRIARSSVHDYVRRGWLKRLAHGLFVRPTDNQKPDLPLDWQVVAASMDKIMEIKFHVGGMTALHLHGLGHYLPMGGKERVQLFGENLPGWLSKISTNAQIETCSPKLLGDARLGVGSLNPKKSAFSSSFSMAFRGLSFPTSTPERAILEAFDELPDGAGFDQLDLVFQGLVNLSPRKLMPLLVACRKVKVLRLFFVFADRHQHAWLKHMDKSLLDFGKGDRQLVKGGKIHPEYRITIPASFLSAGEENSGA